MKLTFTRLNSLLVFLRSANSEARRSIRVCIARSLASLTLSAATAFLSPSSPLPLVAVPVASVPVFSSSGAASAIDVVATTGSSIVASPTLLNMKSCNAPIRRICPTNVSKLSNPFAGSGVYVYGTGRNPPTCPVLPSYPVPRILARPAGVCSMSARQDAEPETKSASGSVETEGHSDLLASAPGRSAPIRRRRESRLLRCRSASSRVADAAEVSRRNSSSVSMLLSLRITMPSPRGRERRCWSSSVRRL